MKPPVDPGPSGWGEILPEAPETPPLEGDTTADWLVIGAGFAGLAAARRLSQLRPEDGIVILEARRVAEGPAGRNSGFMIDLPHDLSSHDYSGALDRDRLTIEDNRRAIDFAADMAAAFGLGPEVFARTGKINGAATARGMAQNATYARHLAGLGEAYNMLSAEDMRALTGTTYYKGGLRTPGTAVIQPAAFVRGVAQGLRSNRISLHEGSPVTGLARTQDWVATTPKGRVTAPKVILAVNGQLERFGHMGGRLMHIFTYASMTRPLTEDEATALGGAAAWGVTPADPLGSTIRRISTPEGARIVTRNRFTYEPSSEAPSGRLPGVWASHDKAFRARFPMLPNVEMEHRWGGRLCLSRNTVQVIGELEPGLWSACCQNGLGTVRGTLAGMLAAEGAAGLPSAALDRALGAAAPSKLPPKAAMRVAAPARIRFGEWKAGGEL